MRPVTFSRQLAAAVVGAVAAAQTTGGAGALVINGTLASGGVATMLQQQRLGFTSAGNDAAVVFTITGTNDQGAVISETVTGVNANTVQTVLDYKTVTSITANAAVAVAVSVDTVGVGASAPVPLDIYLPFGSTASVALLSGAVTYTVQVTNDDPFNTPPSTPLNWVSHPAANLVGANSTQTGTTGNVYRAMRVLTSTGTGNIRFTVTQQGLVT